MSNKIDNYSKDLAHEAKLGFETPCNGSGEFDMLDGTYRVTFPLVNANDSVLGQAITQTITEDGTIHLSVQEKLTKEAYDNGDRTYFHTDETGKTCKIKQRYYHDIDGRKKYVNVERKNITIESDGTLKYNGERIYPEFKSRSGVEVLPTPDGYIGSDCFDTRSDELREVEEQIANYKEALNEYVIIDKDAPESIASTEFTDKFSDKIDNVGERNDFINTAKQEDKLLLTKSDAINYESLCLQENSIEAQYSSIDEQIALLEKQKLQIERNHEDNVSRYDESKKDAYFFNQQYNYYNTKANEYLAETEDENKSQSEKETAEENLKITLYSRKSAEMQKESALAIKNSFVLIDKENIDKSFTNDGDFLICTGWNGTINGENTSFDFLIQTSDYYCMTRADALNYISVVMQLSQLAEQKESLMHENTTTEGDAAIPTQMKAIALQKDTYLSYQDKIIEEFERKVKEYGILLQRLNEIKQYEIVATIKDGGIIKGFNENGQIVLVSDLKGEKQARYEYEDSKVSKLYDEDGNEVKFKYGDNGKISEIIDVKGKKTTFTYDGRITVTYPNGATCTLFISSYGLYKVICGYTNLSTTLNHTDDGKLYSIVNRSEDTILTQQLMEYGTNNLGQSTLLVSNSPDTTKTLYTIDADDGEILSTWSEKDGKMTQAVRYEGKYGYLLSPSNISDENHLYTYTYHKNNLIGKEFDTFVFDDTLCEVSLQIVSPAVDNQVEQEFITECEDSNIEEKNSYYGYDKSRRKIDETTCITYRNPAVTYSFWTLYTYDNNGALVKKESYVEGEELTRGSDITEYVYDKDGREIRSISYNTLSHSDKIYSEREYSEDGKLKCEYDERGLHKTTPVYSGDTIIGSKYPNGSTFVKSYDKYGNTVAITQSTDIGEENSTDRVYENGLVKSVKSGNITLEYGYDNKRRVNSVSLNGIEDYCTTTYEDNTTFYSFSDPGESDPITVDKVTTHVQGNVPVSTYTDKLGKLLEIRVDGARVAHTYDDRGNLTRVYDTGTYNEELYYYDGKDKLTRFDRGTYFETHFYNPTGEVTQSNIGGLTYDYTYSDDSRRELESIAVSGETIKPKKDALGRNIGKEIYNGNTMVARTKMNYVKHGDHTTNMPSTIQYMNGSGGIMYTVSKTLKYAYDNMGNISAIYDNGKLKYRYEYDTLNRLTREDNKLFGKTWTYFYDDNGNIIEKRTYSYTLCDTKDLEEKSYTYNENLYSPTGDRVERVNGYFVTYDDIGRVSQYKLMDCSWNKGKLIGLGSNTFTYDYKGRRTSKNGITFTYDSQGRLVEQSNGIKFIYDDTGVAGMIQGGSLYLYEKDAQGNIISLLDSQGFVVVRYEYDAWGVCKVYDTTGNVITQHDSVDANPFRYRGYYYDVDTGLYYLPARYYDPTTGRFISADDIEYADPETINGLNLYAYCGNNPVMNIDPTGHDWWKWLIGALVIIGLGIATLLTGGAAGGVAGFILAGAFKGAVIGSVSNAIISGTISGIISAVSGGSFWSGFLSGAADGFMSGAIIGGITGAISSSIQVANASKMWANTGNKTGFKQMMEHYDRHVLKEGQQAIAKNIVNYTKQASDFFSKNKNLGTLLREGVIKIKGKTGGIFNINGLIRSFWYK